MNRLNQRLDPGRTGKKAEELQASLQNRIVGQDEAIEVIVRAYQAYLSGLNSAGRPVANFLFLGPTGTGKTRIVEALAESLAGDQRAVLKIDCAEFQHGHEIARLIGAPPGYLGHRETRAMLNQEALNRHHTESMKLSFVLFDEIEKAGDALWNLLLGILDKATLTLGDNQRVDFSHAMIFLTSNLGATEMSNILRPRLGFAAGEIERQRLAGRVDEDLTDRISQAGMEAARRKFTPEFMNRIDHVVVFRPLGDTQLRSILDLELNELRHRILATSEGPAFAFSVTDAAKSFLLREGADLKYGARHLKRTIDRLLVHPMSNLIATDQVRGGDWIRVDFDPEYGCVSFTKQAEALPAAAVAQLNDASQEVPEVTQEAMAVAAQAPMPAAARAKASRRGS